MTTTTQTRTNSPVTYVSVTASQTDAVAMIAAAQATGRLIQHRIRRLDTDRYWAQAWLHLDTTATSTTDPPPTWQDNKPEPTPEANVGSTTGGHLGLIAGLLSITATVGYLLGGVPTALLAVGLLAIAVLCAYLTDTVRSVWKGQHP